MRIDNITIEIEEAIENNDLSLALTKINHALVLDHQNCSVLRFQFYIYLETNRDKEAEEVLEELIRLDDQNNEILLYKAASLNDNGDPTEAIRLCNMIISNSPDFYTAYSFRGLYKSNLAEVEESYKDLNYAIKKDSKNSLVYHNRGSVNLAYELLDQALKDFNKSIKLDKEFDDSKLYKAITLRLLGENLKAYKIIEKINIDNLCDPEELVQIAVIYKNNNDINKSLSLLNKAIQIEPTFVRAYYTSFLINTNISRYDEAELNLDNALKHDDENFRSFILNGYAHLNYKRKKFKEAIDIAKLALIEFPDFFWLKLTLAEVYEKLEEKENFFFYNLEEAIIGGIGFENIDNDIREKYSKDKTFKKLTKRMIKKKHYG